jgi:long-chain acyl-CoA synthetase
MGGKHSDLIYSVPVTADSKGETSVRRHPKAKDNLINYPSEDQRTLQAMILNSEKNFGSRPCLGTRDSEKVYRFKTYNECIDVSRRFGSGLLNLNLVPELNEYKHHVIRFLAVYSKNREEYIFADIASNLYGITTVPIYDTLGPTVITFILEQTNLVTLCATEPGVNTLLQETNLGKLKTIISFDTVTEEQRKKAEGKGIKLYNFQEIVEAGDKQIHPPSKVTPETIYTFSYTSGTTGNPKGVMLSHGNIVAALNTLDYTEIKLVPEDVHLSYLPLAHIFERLIVNAFLGKGGRIGFFNGDVQKLKEDMMDLKPTFFPSVPRLFNRFYDLIRANMGKLTGMKKTIADKAISSKAYYLKNGCHYTHRVYDKLVCNKVKEIFGGRVKYMLTASAPISSEVIDYLKIVCCCPIIEGYGQTESSGASFVTRGDDPTTGHVGGPTVCTEFKLVDVPDMGYTSQG